MDRENQNVKKEDVILEACRRKGPMDETLVRGLIQACRVTNDEYYGNAIGGTKYLQFSKDKEIKKADLED